jgi:hypothetical protein
MEISEISFIYIGSPKIFIEISAESPLYRADSSYIQNHIILPISFHISIQSFWILTQLIIINTTHFIQ